jgi:hypothetical protein
VGPRRFCAASVSGKPSVVAHRLAPPGIAEAVFLGPTGSASRAAPLRARLGATARGCLGLHLFKNAEGGEGQGRAAGAIRYPCSQAYGEGFAPFACRDTRYKILASLPFYLAFLVDWGEGRFDIFISSIDFVKRKR